MLLVLGTVVPQAGAVVIEADSATLSTTGYSTSSATYTTVTEGSPNTFRTQLTGLPAGTKVLVVANFSAQGVTSAARATWRLVANGTTPGNELTMDSTQAYPSVTSVVHLFEGLSGTTTFELQVRLDSGPGIATFAGNMLALPLVTVEDDVLNGAIDGPTSGVATTSASLVDVAGASVTVTLPAEGDVLVAAMFSGVCSAANMEAQWQLYSQTGSVPLGRKVIHELGTAGLRAAGGLVGTAQDLAAGDHTFVLQHAVESNQLTTSQVVLVAVALSLEDGRSFAAYPHTAGMTAAYGNTPGDVLTDAITLEEQSDVVVAGSFYMGTNGGRTAQFRVGVESYSQTGSVSTQATFQPAMATSIGLFEDLSAGGHTARLQLWGPNPNQIWIEEASLVTLLLNTAARPEGEGEAIDLYRAFLTTPDKRNIVDTCRARSVSEARSAFISRHMDAHIVSILYIEHARSKGYRLYLGGVRTADGRNVRDTCWAKSVSQAREIIGERYPGGIVNHMGFYPLNRKAITYYSVTQRPDLFETLEAGSLQEAFLTFAHTFFREHIVRVVQVSDENTFHTYEGTLDPEEASVVVHAASAEAAAEAAETAHPRCRVVEISSLHPRDGVTTYEAIVRAGNGRSGRDTCSARSPSEAQKILRDRYGDGSSASVSELDWDDNCRLYEAGISMQGQGNFTDAVFAKTVPAAHAAFGTRYPEGTVSRFMAVTDLSKYHEYAGRLNTTDGRNLMDTCWAASPAAAREVLQARFPTAKIRSVTPFGTNRPDAFEVVLKDEPTRELCQARDKAEAYRILSERFPQARVVTVRQCEDEPTQPVYRAVLNTPEHRTIVDTVEASGPSEARKLLLLRHPGSRFTSFQEMSGGQVDETYQARIDLPPAKDTCQAYSPAEARLIFQGRYPRGSVSSLKIILGRG